MLGRKAIPGGSSQDILRDVVAQKRRDHHQVWLKPAQVVAEQPAFIKGCVAAHTGVDHAHTGITRVVQVTFENGRERLFVRHLTADRVTVPEHHDAEFACWFRPEAQAPDASLLTKVLPAEQGVDISYSIRLASQRGRLPLLKTVGAIVYRLSAEGQFPQTAKVQGVVGGPGGGFALGRFENLGDEAERCRAYDRREAAVLQVRAGVIGWARGMRGTLPLSGQPGVA